MVKLFNIIVFLLVIYLTSANSIYKIGTHHKDEVLLSSTIYSTPPTINPTNHTLLFKHLETARTTVWSFDMLEHVSGFDVESKNFGPRINIRVSLINVLQTRIMLSIYGFPPDVPIPTDFNNSKKLTEFIDHKSIS